ncbi:MAG: 1,4-dihydroxy-2-naphthoate octaprenyltransferase [Bacteroidota bacterium]
MKIIVNIAGTKELIMAKGFLKKWILCARPFSFPASTMPVVFGTVLATVYGHYAFRPGLFLLALVAMVMLHSGANILSDIYDFRKGLDKVPTPVSGGVVRGLISEKEAFRGAAVLLISGALIGFLLAYLCGPWLLAIGVGGLFVGIFYTTNAPFSLKYHGLGDLAVFLNFGILGSLGSWYVQSGTLSFIPVIWAIPMATLVIAILHANNWRDIESDLKGRIHTVASLLGDRGSSFYYAFLIFGPYVMILLFILVPYFIFPSLPKMPFTFLITLFALPLSVKLWKTAVKRKNLDDPMDFITLDGATARLNLQFGLLSTLALLLNLAFGLLF